MKFIIAGILVLLSCSNLFGYPLDAAEETGISRLAGYQLIQQGKVRGRTLFPGALLPLKQVQLRLLSRPELDLPEADPELSEKILEFLGEDQDLYSFSLLDLSHPEQPVLAEHQGELSFNPGSLGKMLIAVGLFQALADLYPDDIEARRRLLRDRWITADQFIQSDNHKVPFWNAKEQRMIYRKIRAGDSTNLYSWLDWMLSPSSNAAAAMVLREYLLMVQFKAEYPVNQQTAEIFFKTTRKSELMRLLLSSLHEPMRRNGLNPEQLRQGGFFTWKGKQLVPGGSSKATTHSFMTLLMRMEQGRLVDPFSSLELKRLLYMTEKRIRYASHPALKHSAVYFKSGSLYSCEPEPGFKCVKYQGNKKNLLNSVAIIEEQQGESLQHYLIVVSSNVLKVNSAVAHQTLAMRIHRLMQANNRKWLQKRGSTE
ncbi:MAG: serine hydrolase [Desulfuromusa sp.]|nr:serine hydrolase [Desulfuromusa sp.]